MDANDHDDLHRAAHFSAVQAALREMSSGDLTALVERIHDLPAVEPPHRPEPSPGDPPESGRPTPPTHPMTDAAASSEPQPDDPCEQAERAAARLARRPRGSTPPNEPAGPSTHRHLRALESPEPDGPGTPTPGTPATPTHLRLVGASDSGGLAPADDIVVLRVRVDIVGASPPVWRRLLIRSDLTLESLHDVLQVAFGWTDAAGHGFRTEPARWCSLLGTPGESGDDYRSRRRVGEFLRAAGDRLWYLYGDRVRRGHGWTHVLRVESSEPASADAPEAVAIAGRRAGPLEALQGNRAHNSVVAALAADPTGATLLPQVRVPLPRGGYDATAFSLPDVNAGLDYLENASCPSQIPAALYPLLMRQDDWLLRHVDMLCLRVAELPLLTADVVHLARPYRTLLDLAGDDGLPLTPAGWLDPDVVARLHAALRLDRLGIEADPRESRVRAVATLRADAVALGLLRLRSGSLVRTPLGRAMRSDDDIVALLAGHTRKPDGEDVVAAAATCLTALMIADTGELDVDHEAVTSLIFRGQRRNRLTSPLEPTVIEKATRRTRRILERARDLDADGAVTPDSAAATAAHRRLRAFAALIARDPS